MSAPLVTILIDTYNYGRFIEEAVESALAQEFPREQREILVVDDGSTDDTGERLKKYGDAIRYLRKPNGGQASAFNLGFAEARGEIIALLDADDLWLPQKLRRVYETLEKNPDAGMVYHRTYLWKGGEQAAYDNYFVEVSGHVPQSRVSLLRYPMVGTSCLAFRRSALSKLLPVPEALRSQADAYLTSLIIFIAPVAALPEFHANYRIHGANLFQASEGGAARDAIEHRMAMRGALLREIHKWFERNGYDPGSKDLQAYMKQWTKAQEMDGFKLHKPSRWKYFRHLLEFPRIYGEIMTARHRIFGYVQASGALVLGYDHAHLVDDFRKGYKRMLGERFGGARRSGERKEAAAEV
ncbi:MAG TPA: glycosyltransferase [Candidatus Acidoferrum sp.]|nr:glycosyltransferase [Candidatus Acidoferrum sp.]